MKNIENLRERRAVSPVIATVILVAVAITVAVGVSYWMSGIAGQYTNFEKVEIKTAICTSDATGFTIIIKLKNSGSATSTLSNVFINDVEVSAYGSSLLAGEIRTSMTTVPPFTLTSGQELPISVFIGAGYGTLSAGTTVNIKIHSAGGMDYIKLVQLR